MNDEKKAIEILKHCKGRNFSAFDIIYFDDGTNMCVFQAVETLLTFYEKQKDKIKKAVDFINDENNFFEDGENFQNVLKIKEILEEN